MVHEPLKNIQRSTLHRAVTVKLDGHSCQIPVPQILQVRVLMKCLEITVNISVKLTFSGEVTYGS
jgi:hypothetical protein